MKCKMNYKLDDKVRITHKDFDGETGTIVVISSNPQFYKYRVLLDIDTEYNWSDNQLFTLDKQLDGSIKIIEIKPIRYSYGFDEDDLELMKEGYHDEMQDVQCHWKIIV